MLTVLMGQEHPLPGWLIMVTGLDVVCVHGRILALASGKDRSWQGNFWNWDLFNFSFTWRINGECDVIMQRTSLN